MLYLKKFTGNTDYQNYITGDPALPNASIVVDGQGNPTVYYNAESPEPPQPVGPPSDEIWYTATEKITPYDTTVFGATYLPEDSTFDSTTGEGILKFDGNVTSIGEYAFLGCGLSSVTIGNSVTSIGSDAFCNCTGLTSVTIPYSVTSIGDSAFDSCNNLSEFTFGTGIVNLGNNLFSYDAENHEPMSIIFQTTTPPSLVDGKNIIHAFDSQYDLDYTIYVPESAVNTYKTFDEGWVEIAEHIEGY